jgi:hypothetical protein
MSITALATTAVTGVAEATTRLSVRAIVAVSDATGPVLAGGIITTANDQLNQFKALIIVAGGIIGLIAFFAIAIKKSWAMGGIIQGLFVGALIAFAVGGGGTIWLGNQVKDQLGS